MSTYRDRRAARAERLDEWAAKREAKAQASLADARAKADLIPFGQPILVGHHSEGRDRRYRAGISRTYERGFEHAAKAKATAGRADGIRDQLDASIYDDDPDAVDALQARIADLEAERDRIKAYNASCRKGAPDESLLDDAQRERLAGVRRVAPYQLGKGGAFPAYALSNLSGNIKRNRDRLESIRRRRQRSDEAEAAGGVVVTDLPGGYAQVTFADKPERVVIDALHAAGFHFTKGSWFGEAASLPEGVSVNG